MIKGEWNQPDILPEKEGIYVIRFHLEDCEDTYCVTDFRNGKWLALEELSEALGEMIGWQDMPQAREET